MGAQSNPTRQEQIVISPAARSCKTSFVNALNKCQLYFRAAAALRSPNWPGLPLIPKPFGSGFPGNRSEYNSFILWIKKLGLPAAQRIVDVGANQGDFARAAGACFPGAEVLVAEPLPKMQRCLEQIIRVEQKKWRLLPCALGAEPGRLPLFVDEQRDNIASLAGFNADYLKANPDARPAAETLCEVKTLDAVAAELHLEQIDLLKIDVEGFEFEVLKGAARMLPKTTAIIIEVSLVRKTGAGNALVEMLALLIRNGFHVVNVIPSLFAPDEPWKPGEFNVLARRELKPR
jgi:FkbM family methyltransferase